MAKPQPVDLSERYPPAATLDLFGHEEIERALLDSLASGKLPHGLIFYGPKGVGKETLAYRLARYLLTGGSGHDATMAVAENQPIVGQLCEGVAQDFKLIECPVDEKSGVRKSQIPVEHTREVVGFFTKTSSHGGHRIALIDAIDDLNRHGQNALLKTLEEPPPKGLLILISHNLGSVLPTIRSRCRVVPFSGLSDKALVDFLAARSQQIGFAVPGDERFQLISALSSNLPGRALEIAAGEGLGLFDAILKLLAQGLQFKDGPLYSFADAATKGHSTASLALFFDLLGALVRRIGLAAAAGRHSGLGQYDPQIMTLAKAAPASNWATLWGDLNKHFHAARALNAQPKATIIEALRLVQSVAGPTQR